MELDIDGYVLSLGLKKSQVTQLAYFLKEQDMKFSQLQSKNEELIKENEELKEALTQIKRWGNVAAIPQQILFIEKILHK